MTTNEAIKIVEQAIRSNGLNIHKINRLDIIRAAEEMVKAQGDDPHVRPCEIVPFNTQR